MRRPVGAGDGSDNQELHSRLDFCHGVMLLNRQETEAVAPLLLSLITNVPRWILSPLYSSPEAKPVTKRPFFQAAPEQMLSYTPDEEVKEWKSMLGQWNAASMCFPFWYESLY